VLLLAAERACQMFTAEQYRAKAAEFRALLTDTPCSPNETREFRDLEQTYTTLARMPGSAVKGTTNLSNGGFHLRRSTMQLQSAKYRRWRGRASTFVGAIAATLLLVAIDGVAAPASAQQAMADIAYVEDVSGRVVAFALGKPILLNALDTISDRTRLDLQANSELRICHYPTRQFLTLKGPLKASISRDGVTGENDKVAAAATGPCVLPVVSTFQGGLVSRGAGVKALSVPLQPNIRVLNRGTQPIRKTVLWDGDARSIVMSFERDAARPTLNEGQFYVLVVERSDGSEFKMMLQASGDTRADPVIVVVP
jgi:hypothetical protein